MIAAFAEVRLDRGIDYGAGGGPEFSTEVVPLHSGAETRNINWEAARGAWQLGQRNIDRAELEALLAFFRARRGKAQGFRFKDWSDWRVEDEPLPVSGDPTVQLVKTYTSGGENYVRAIVKPVEGTVVITNNGAPITASIDPATGLATFGGPATTLTITNVASAYDGARITLAAAYSRLDYVSKVRITGTGIAGLDNQFWSVEHVNDSVFDVPFDRGATTAAQGTVAIYPQPADTTAWSGEFDVPARFDTDTFNASFLAYREDDHQAIYSLGPLPVVEIRL